MGYRFGQLVSPCCVPSKPLAHLQAIHWVGRVRNREGPDAVQTPQQKLEHHYDFGAVLVTNPKASSVRAAMEDINSSQNLYAASETVWLPWSNATPAYL